MKSRLLSILGYWISLRIFLSFIVLIASASDPRTQVEKNIAVWPPSKPVLAWTERVFLEPWNRWDVEYYLKIATHGYRNGDGTAQFHPLYPWLGRLAGFVLGGNMLAGLLVLNSLCGLLFLVLFYWIAELDVSAATAKRAVMLCLHAPIAFILFAPYSEGLFLLCASAMFLMARRRAWWLAGTAGALAALTRQQGLFLVLPLAWEFWEATAQPASQRRWRDALSILLIPTGLFGWILYRAIALRDVSFDMARPQTWVYGLIISKDSSNVVTEQGFAYPWKVLGAAFTNPQSTTIIDLIQSSIFLVLLVLGASLLWRTRRSYVLYAGVILLVSFSYYTGPYQPYMGLTRHCLLAFPLFIPLAWWAERPWVESIITACGLLGAVFLAYCYSAQLLWLP
jgi:hypothetical protein